jgi:serine/threonine-protein kinase
MLVADPQLPDRQRTKVLDFGLAKLAAPEGSPFIKTSSNNIMGTPLYMSPEQCAGAGKVDARSDVYSLGCLLYEMLSGRPPFLAEGAGQLLGMHMYDRPEPLGRLAPRTPKPVVQLVHALLSKDRAQRPAMADVARRLGELQRLAPFEAQKTADAPGALGAEDLRKLALGATVRQMLPPLRSRRLIWASATALVVLSCAVAAVIGARSWSKAGTGGAEALRAHTTPRAASASAASTTSTTSTASTGAASTASMRLPAAAPDGGAPAPSLAGRISLPMETEPAGTAVLGSEAGKRPAATPLAKRKPRPTRGAAHQSGRDRGVPEVKLPVKESIPLED